MKRILCFSYICSVLAASAHAAAIWNPITPQELALKKPVVDPAADAEALFWEMYVADAASNNQYPYTTYKHYIRIKIFTDRGVQRFGTVDIEYSGKQTVFNVAGRTIRPDGSTVEMGKDAVFDHVVVKGRGRKVHVRSFALPGVQPGSIIEYRWQENHTDELASYIRLPAQRDIPIQHLVYHLKPLVHPAFPYAMRYQPFNVKLPKFEQSHDGFYHSSVDNIPAWHEEEDSPPEFEARAWVLIYYEEDRKETVEKYWKSEGKRLYNRYKDQAKVNGEIRKLAAQITAGATSPDEQLSRLFAYCQHEIKDVWGSDITEEERQRAKSNNNAADTLKRKLGTPWDVQIAFLTLAEASGFDARLAYLGDRDFLTFQKELQSSYYLRATDVAVKVGDKWRFYDVSSRYLPPGHLRWQEEGAPALITSDKDPEFVDVPLNSPIEARSTRTAKLTLHEDGALEGAVTEFLTGHLAEEWRLANRRRSESEREKTFRDEVTSRLPGAELSNVKLGDPNRIIGPMQFEYQIKVPSYATRTGRRLFLKPAFFEANQPARYSSSTRYQDICFRFPWSEVEDVTIAVPQGYVLDHGDAPAPLKFDPLGNYNVQIRVGKNVILYHRELQVGTGARVCFGQGAYKTLKTVFDSIHDSDGHMLTLKVETQPGASATN